MIGAQAARSCACVRRSCPPPAGRCCFAFAFAFFLPPLVVSSLASLELSASASASADGDWAWRSMASGENTPPPRTNPAISPTALPSTPKDQSRSSKLWMERPHLGEPPA